jgi:putative spermidine/putrescine transport system permease protein
MKAGALARGAHWIFTALVGAFLLLPMLITVPISFTDSRSIQFPPTGFSLRWYENIVSSDVWTSATITSLKVAVLTSIFSVVLGTSAALALQRAKLPGKALINALVLSPLVTPVIVLAVGIYMVFVRWGLSGTLLGLALAHTVLATPFVIVSVSASLQMLNPNLELASLGLGAGPVRTFRRVTLPLIMPGALSGAIFAFITSWDEVVVAIFLTNASLRTIPVVIWSQVRAEMDPTMAAVGTILIVVSALGLGLIHLLWQRQST